MINFLANIPFRKIRFPNLGEKSALKFLYLIFFFSGISALIYQVTWQRLLTVHYGVGAVSTTLIVSIYMLGLGFGSLLGGYLAERFPKNGIYQYFLIELGIGIFGLLSFPLIMTIGTLTANSSYFLVFIYNFLLLLVPTMLMGMTLPILIKIFSRSITDLSRSLSRLYFINTLGAGLGTLLTSYLLISFFGIDIAIYAAALTNIILALGIFIIQNHLSTKHLPAENHIEDPRLADDFLATYAPALVFITGFIAIGYELIWFRIIGILIKSSPYAFSSVLAVYLIGVALGSLIVGKIIKKLSATQRSSLFCLLQVLLATCVAIIFISYYYATLLTPFKVLTDISFNQSLHPPFHLLRQHINLDSPAKYILLMFKLGTTLFWPMLFVFIPTLFIGATFPIIAGAVNAKNNPKVAWHIGKIYFFNITGNVLGALITGFVLLPRFGTEQTLLLFILVGLLFAVPLIIKKKSAPAYAYLTIAIVLTFCLFPKRATLYEVIHPKLEGYTKYFEEGVSGVVMTFISSEEKVKNYINGDSHGGRPGYTFYAHVLAAASCAKKANEILVIGYGTGSVVEAALKVRGVKKVTLVELNQTLLTNLQKIPLFRGLLSDPKLEIVVEDARRFLNKTPAVYDLVFMSPLRSKSAYSNNIYSQQFFALVSSRLTKQGIFVAWSDNVDATFRTLDKVFDHMELHINGPEGFFLASNTPLTPNPENLYIPILESFSPVDSIRISEIVTHFRVVPKIGMEKIAKTYLPAQDWRPNSEYYIGLWFKTAWRFEKEK